MESKICAYPACGKTFYCEGHPNHINWKRQKYCCKTCAGTHHRELRRKKKPAPRESWIKQVSESVTIKRRGLGNGSVRNHLDPPRMTKIPVWFLYPKGWEKVAEQVCKVNRHAQHVPGLPLYSK